MKRFTIILLVLLSAQIPTVPKQVIPIKEVSNHRYILRVRDSEGNIVYEGIAPESIQICTRLKEEL